METFKKEWAEMQGNLKNGPPQERSTTDICCCLIFIVFMIGMGAVFVYGLYYERLSHITIGWDSDAKGCGFTPGYEDYPYLYWVTAPNQQQFEDIKSGNLIAKKKAVF